jgi:hypothetical protein
MPAAVDPPLVDRALDRAGRGELLTIADMLEIFRLSRTTFDRHAKRGAFDRFRVVPTVGRVRYAGALVFAHITGVYKPTTFAAKRGPR